MKKILLILLSIQLSFISVAIAQNNPIEAFSPLIGGSWISEGVQLGGHKGKTEIKFVWGLDGKIVKATTYTTDPETLKFGLRNEGIRTYNVQQKTIEFYEFDKLGGVTVGKVVIEGKNLHYEYEYSGTSLRDSWIYINENKYQFIVGIWNDDSWQKKFHEGVFIREN